MPEKGELQLLPEARRKVEIKVPQQKKFFTISIVVLILVGAGYAASFYYKGVLQEELMAIDLQIENIDRSRNKEAEETLLTLEKQLSLMSKILNDHVFWSSGFDRLERLMKPEVRADAVNADISNNSLQIRAVARDFTTVAKLIASFNSDSAIEDVSVTDISLLPEGAVSFDLRLSFNKSEFLKK